MPWWLISLGGRRKVRFRRCLPGRGPAALPVLVAPRSAAGLAGRIGDALKSDDLPTYKVVIAVIEGCGGDQDDQQAYATAWRRLNIGHLDPQPAAEATG